MTYCSGLYLKQKLKVENSSIKYWKTPVNFKGKLVLYQKPVLNCESLQSENNLLLKVSVMQLQIKLGIDFIFLGSCLQLYYKVSYIIPD